MKERKLTKLLVISYCTGTVLLYRSWGYIF